MKRCVSVPESYTPRRGAIPYGLLGGLLALIAGCSSQPGDGPPDHPIDVSTIPDAVPIFEPRSRAANPDSYVVLGKRYHVMKESHGFVQRGIASWYGRKFHGQATASGEIYDMFSMTAAHKTLPIPSYVRVTNLENGRRIVVKVNDRGPFHEGRIIDLSYVAAVKLGVNRTGTAPVEIELVEPECSAPRAKEIFLQLGAFSDLVNAKRLMAQLNQANLPKPLIQSSQLHGQKLFRVRIGPLETQDQLDELARQLREQGFKPTVVYNN